MKNVHPVLSDGNSLILFKQLNESLINKAIYLSASIIVYIKTGRQIIHDNDGVSNLVDENHLIFLTKGIYTVSDFVPAQGVFNAVLFSIDDKLIDKYLSSLIDGVRVGNQLPLNQVRGTYVIQANEQIRRYIHSLADVYSEFGQTPALVELKLLELLHLIARQDPSYRFVRELSSRVRNNKNHRSITDFMEQYYSHKLNVDDYALLTGRSVSTFLRDFKRIYNTTPNKWIVDKKVEVAQGLMLTNNYSVTRAALEAGFEDVSNFIKVYKRKYGVTPKQSKSRIEQMQYENIVSI
jgi:AraC-like DNA-binding protein